MSDIFRIFLATMLIIFVVSYTAESQCPPQFVFTGEAPGDQLGYSVASAGDVDNDGHSDLIIGAFGNDTEASGAGSAYVFSGLDASLVYVFSGEVADDEFGISVASAGDVDNDGYSDVIIGAHGNDAGGLDAGRVYVFSGQTGDTLYVFTGEAEGDVMGSPRAVGSAGDVNNDGFDDLIVGANANDEAGIDAGKVYVFSGIDGDTLYTFLGEADGDHSERCHSGCLELLPQE